MCAALDDPAAILMLAQINLGAAQTEAEFYTIVDTLIHAMTTLGDAVPAADLYGAFLCKAPDAPRVNEAAYWARAEAATGSISTQLTPSEVTRLVTAPDPLVMAALQTEALYGRATPLATLIDVLERTKAPASTLAFWTAYASQFSNVGTARATLSLEQATTQAARDAALDQFRAAVAAGETGAPLKLAKALLQDGSAAARVEALSLLGPLANDGNGQAMALLPVADPVSHPTLDAVAKAYAKQIDARGDFDALMLAMPFQTDLAVQDTYRGRAITAMTCDFHDALAFAGVVAAQGDLAEARRWLTIAGHLTGTDAWQIVALGDGVRNLLGREGEAEALASYEQAYALGNRTAVLRLLLAYGNPATKAYDKDRAVQLYVDLVALSDPGAVAGVLEDLSRKDAGLRLAVESQLDLDQLYADAATAGNPAAMREHARRLQGAALTVDELKASTAWLIRASEGGDTGAMVLLAQAYSMGVGVPASIDDARGWLVKAATAGDAAAITMVKLFTVGQGTN